MDKRTYGIFSIPVVVGALGYFVDIYDLLLFGIIRKASLADLGLSPEEILTKGEWIISIQMAGLMIGGILWGVMGDKRGRLSVLFGSILLYSLANIANGMVQTADQYALLRFIAGIGLAGELGAGITLVSELLPKEKRGIGTSLVAGIGLTGAVVAFFISQQFDWRICYYIGGAMGLLLLLLRVGVFESGMFKEVKEMDVQKGNFLMFFNNKNRFYKYLKSILIGLPTWFVIGVLVSFSDKFAIEMGITEPVSPGRAIMYAYVGISIGDVLIGLVSQWLKSRKMSLYIFYAITAVFMVLYFNQQNGSAAQMYWLCAGLGFGTGFWAIFVTMAAEQFGTNLRATAATTIPNMVRGSLPLIIILFKLLREQTDYLTGGMITGGIIMVITVIAAYLTKETFGKDLMFLEGDPKKKANLKILVVRFSSIGDIVLTTPVIRCLKQQLPGVEVHYLTKHSFRGILQSNPYIDKLHLLEDNFAAITEQLIAEEFDYIIDLHNNLRTLKIKRALNNVPAYSFNKLNIRKWVLTALKINLMPKVHIVDRYMATVKDLGVVNDGKGLDYFIPEKDILPDSDIPTSHLLGYIGVVIGAAHNTKKLPVQKLKELCSRIDHPIILLGGPEDRAAGEEIAAVDPVKIYNSCGKFNLNESADLVRRSRLIISHDTGLMHIAAAFNKPIISVWGNTVPAFGMTPYFGQRMVPETRFEVKGLWCRPCSKIGYNKCPLGHFKCMNKQEIEQMVRTAIAGLSRK